MKINLDLFKTMTMFTYLIGFGSVFSVYHPLLADLLTILALTIQIIQSDTYRVKIKFIFLFILLFLFCVISAIYTQTSINHYYGILFRVVVTLLTIVGFNNSYNEIKHYLIKAIWVIVYLSIANFIVTNIFTNLLQESYSENGFRVYSLFYIFNYLAVHQFGFIEIVRNQSIFWEPGVLQIPINILIYYILIEEKRKISNASLPIFVLITTASTTGFIIFAITLLFYFRTVLKDNISSKYKLVMICIVAVLIPFSIIEVKNKFSSEEGNMSSSARIYDLLMSFIVINNNKLIGIGPDQEKYFNEIENYSILVKDEEMSVERGSTNTILKFFVNFGIPCGVLLMYALYNQRIFKNKLLFFIIICLSLMSEPLMVVYLTLLLLLSCLNLNSDEDFICIR